MLARLARRPPSLVVELDLEQQTPRVRIVAETAEDEARIRAWLRRSRALHRLPAAVQAALDWLDQEAA